MQTLSPTPVRAIDTLVPVRSVATPSFYATPMQPARWRRLARFFERPGTAISVLTLFALLIYGYHPYADDGAIYVAGIEKVVDPGLFPVHAAFILPHLKHSLFSFALGWSIRELHLPLAYALFAVYIASIWLTLYGCFQLGRLLFTNSHAQWGGVLLLSAILTLPVAGTAIFFTDPYLTARSLSTPATLFAIAYALKRRMIAAMLCLIAAFLLHPLMAAYGIGYVIALVLIQNGRWRWLAGLGAAAMALGFAGSHAGTLLGDSPAYRMAATSRPYFFLDHWRWFEICGLFPPLAAAWMYLSRRNFRLRSNLSHICAASFYTGILAILFAVCFTRTEAGYLLARLQPLRMFQLIYVLFFLALGGLLGARVLQRRWWAWAACFFAIAGIMFAAQMRTYPSLRHIEWPWSQARNPWEQAFLWIRANTPKNSFFALDPHYQFQPGEDAIGFRATAQRSSLPDWTKDGGVAAIDPAIAPQWLSEVTKTENFSRWTDEQRIQILAPLGINWLVLPARAATNFPCPYENSVVRVCRLPMP